MYRLLSTLWRPGFAVVFDRAGGLRYRSLGLAWYWPAGVGRRGGEWPGRDVVPPLPDPRRHGPYRPRPGRESSRTPGLPMPRLRPLVSVSLAASCENVLAESTSQVRRTDRLASPSWVRTRLATNGIAGPTCGMHWP